MILSVSRRTDIPAFYSDWFFKRIEQGFVIMANPFNPRQLNRIDLHPEIVDCIAFWTKNPIPMMSQLDRLENYRYFFQFTLTPYGKDIEKDLPDKEKELLPAFCKLSQMLGKHRVVWRYDPIIFTTTFTADWHLMQFKSFCQKLCGYTDRVVISFLDLYAKTRRNMAHIPLVFPDDIQIRTFSKHLCEIANQYGMQIQTCAEMIDLSDCGIPHGACLDPTMIEHVCGYSLDLTKASGQRTDCRCIDSIDIGVYDTCANGCCYCYANSSVSSIETNRKNFDPNSPILCRTILPEDNVRVKNCISLRRVEQHSFFD